MAEKKLKTVVTAETSDFKKGMRESKAALADFQKQGERSLSAIASNLGGASGALGSLSGNITNATNLFRGLFRQSEAGLTTMRSSIAAVGGALAGLGITAVITAFQELNREAKSFETRLQGVNLAASAKAYRETYRQALDDITGAGERRATWWEGFKDNWSRDWANITHPFASRDQRAWANATAQQAADLASERVDLNRELDASLVTQAQYQKDINEQLKIARDRSASKSERDAAQAKAVELINQKYDQQLDIANRILANQEAMDSLTKNTDAETRETYQAQANVLNIEAQRQQELTSMVRLENQITGTKTSQAKAAKETQEATALTLAAATELVTKERELAEISKQNDLAKAAARFRLDGSLPSLSGDGLQSQAAIMVPATIVPKVDTSATQKAIIELADVIESGVIGMSDALGGLIGDLINGQDAWGNFAQAGISVVADMLATVGKAFIAEGVGVIAAQTALVTGAGPGAVAAGAAMVALAATMKSAMSNAAANWGGGYSTSVASSAYTGQSLMTSFGREMTVKVTGTLTGDGSKLVAVLNNEGERRNYTT